MHAFPTFLVVLSQVFAIFLGSTYLVRIVLSRSFFFVVVRPLQTGVFVTSSFKNGIGKNDALAPRPEVLISWYFVCSTVASLEHKFLPHSW